MIELLDKASNEWLNVRGWFSIETVSDMKFLEADSWGDDNGCDSAVCKMVGFGVGRTLFVILILVISGQIETFVSVMIDVTQSTVSMKVSLSSGPSASPEPS